MINTSCWDWCGRKTEDMGMLESWVALWDLLFCYRLQDKLLKQRHCSAFTIR